MGDHGTWPPPVALLDFDGGSSSSYRNICGGLFCVFNPLVTGKGIASTVVTPGTISPYKTPCSWGRLLSLLGVQGGRGVILFTNAEY